ncbi:hypothetical protein DVH24_032990 [Malus domestica]|uniref:Uncharacterized protein n=1 Tax=Malus domestica TaxID=3750 RepID=A0A498IMW6_MALDO|nr:hypothetical protein DVH24_032990 [Malus domestica]
MYKPIRCHLLHQNFILKILFPLLTICIINFDCDYYCLNSSLDCLWGRQGGHQNGGVMTCIRKCTKLPFYTWSGRGECRLALPPFYGEAAPKSRTRDLPLMGEGTYHRTKCDLFNVHANII